MANERLLTPREVAERWGVPLSKVYDMTRKEKIPGLVRLGKYCRMRECEVKRFEEGGGMSNDSQ